MIDPDSTDSDTPLAPGWGDSRRWKWAQGLSELGATEEEMQAIIQDEFNTNFRSVGAIVGDIAGSRYEFNNSTSRKFELLANNCYITDDSVLTVATMQALLDGGTTRHFANAYRKIPQSYLLTTDLDGKTHGIGYGARFFRWLMTEKARPYNSLGNGAPMRVSPVAWFYDTLEEVEGVAEASARVTHNHPEGIKGAKSVAGAILLARMGMDKATIKSYVERYGYDLDFTLDEIRGSYRRSEASQHTVPQAVVAFLEGGSFEDTIRNAISIGGDSDTISAIAGSIAEAFYGVPENIHERTLKYVPEQLLEIIANFDKTVRDRNHIG